MMIFLAVGVLLDGFMVSGFLTSRKNRSTDWRCYATYIGFIAAVAAVTGVMINALGFHLRGHESPYAMSPALQAYNFLSGLLIFAALSVTFFTGLLSRGQRSYRTRRLHGFGLPDAIRDSRRSLW